MKKNALNLISLQKKNIFCPNKFFTDFRFCFSTSSIVIIKKIIFKIMKETENIDNKLTIKKKLKNNYKNRHTIPKQKKKTRHSWKENKKFEHRRIRLHILIFDFF